MKFTINYGGDDKIQVMEGNCPSCKVGPYTVVLLSEKILRNTTTKKYLQCICCLQEFSAVITTIDKKDV